MTRLRSAAARVERRRNDDMIDVKHQSRAPAQLQRARRPLPPLTAHQLCRDSSEGSASSGAACGTTRAQTGPAPPRTARRRGAGRGAQIATTGGGATYPDRAAARRCRRCPPRPAARGVGPALGRARRAGSRGAGRRARPASPLVRAARRGDRGGRDGEPAADARGDDNKVTAASGARGARARSSHERGAARDGAPARRRPRSSRYPRSALKVAATRVEPAGKVFHVRLAHAAAVKEGGGGEGSVCV